MVAHVAVKCIATVYNACDNVNKYVAHARTPYTRIARQSLPGVKRYYNPAPPPLQSSRVSSLR